MEYSIVYYGDKTYQSKKNLTHSRREGFFPTLIKKKTNLFVQGLLKAEDKAF